VPAAVRATRDGRNRAARGWAFGLLIALLVQFGLGMYVNLFAHIPLNHPGHGALLFAAAVLCYIVLLALPGRTERQAPAA
jgi:heme A synthase